jgi:hypothetical protein
VLFNIFLVVSGFLEAFSRDEPWFRQRNPDGTVFLNKYTNVFPGPLNELLWVCMFSFPLFFLTR